MKKIWALGILFLTTLVLSACSAFVDDITQTYPTDEPLTMAVFLQVNDMTTFTVAQFEAWKGELNRIIIQMAADTENTEPKITSAVFRDTGTNLQNTYTVDLTLTNVPASTVQKTVRPFKIDYTQTIYNPIQLLPTSETFTYVIGYTSERRHSSANANKLVTEENGNYVYLWTTSDPIVLHDIYPNRPLYYFLVLCGAGIIGGIVYAISRFNDCKRQQKTL